MAQDLSTPDPSLSRTHLSIRRGHATTTHYTHHGVAQHYTSHLPGVVHWASLSGRPQRWHAKRACATPKEKEEKKEKKYTASCRRKQAVYQMVKTNADWHILLHIFIIIKLMNIITKKLRDYIKLALYKYA